MKKRGSKLIALLSGLWFLSFANAGTFEVQVNGAFSGDTKGCVGFAVAFAHPARTWKSCVNVDINGKDSNKMSFDDAANDRTIYAFMQINNSNNIAISDLKVSPQCEKLSGAIGFTQTKVPGFYLLLDAAKIGAAPYNGKYTVNISIDKTHTIDCTEAT